MRRLLRALHLAEYGGNELLLAAAAALALATCLWRALAPAHAWFALPPFLYFLWFFRDPERVVPDGPGLFVAPADGRVLDIAEAEEPEFIGGRAVCIGIFLSPLSVHVNRAPCAGVVRRSEHRRGEFLPAYAPDAPRRNESWFLGLETADGLKVVVRQVTGILARRIVCESKPGDQLARGRRYGMMKFGSRTELWLPVGAHCAIRAQVGQKVVGGVTVLAKR